MRSSRVDTPRIHPAFAGAAGAAVRRCARPDCSATGAVTLVCDYTARTVVMVAAADAPEVDDPARYDLCTRHAERFRPPHGWELTVDVRAQEPAPEPAPVAERRLGTAERTHRDDRNDRDDRAANAFAQLALSDLDPRELAAALG